MTFPASRTAGLLAAALSVAALAAPVAFAQQTPAAPPAPTPPAQPAPAPQNPPANLPVTPPAPVTPAPSPNQQRGTMPTPRPNGAVGPMVKPKPPVKLPPNIVARVGGRDVTREEVLAMFDMQHGRPLVGQLVQVVALQQEAKRLGVAVTPAEIAAGVKKTKQDIVTRMMQTGTPMTFEEFAVQNGVTEEMLRYSVGLDLLRRKALSKTLEAGVQPLEKQYKLAHILIATIPLQNSQEALQTPPTPEDQKKKDEAAKAKIDAIYADIKAGRVTFDDAAKLNSDDTSNKDKGGLLGWSMPGFFVPEFDKAAFAIQKPGEIVGPIKTNFGWHLIKLIAKGSDATKAEKAAYRQEQVNQNLDNPQVSTQWMNGVMERANIVVNPAVRLVPNAQMPSLFTGSGGGAKAAPAVPKKAVKKASTR